MRVHHGLDFRPHIVHRQVHQDLAGALAPTLDLVAFHIANDQVVGMHHTLANARGGGQNALRVQADGDVAVVRGDPSFFKNQTANLDDVFAVFALRFHHCGTSDCSRMRPGRPLPQWRSMMVDMDSRRMCPHCRAFITGKDKVCPYCNERVGAAGAMPPQRCAASRRAHSHARFYTMLILLINFGLLRRYHLFTRMNARAGAIAMDLDARDLYAFGAKLGRPF